MSKSAFSVRVWAIYLLGVGSILVLVPNLLLSLLQVPQTGEPWIRVVGMLVLVLSYYHFMASGKAMFTFYRWTVHVRLAVPVFYIALIASGIGPPVLILFGLVEALGALWTAYCLRTDAIVASATASA
jgi:hypothetical protein